MLAVNELIQRAYESIGMTGLGESVNDYDSDNMAVTAVNELNRVITQLNNEGYISMSQKWVDAPCAREIFFRKLQAGEIRTDATVDMVAPEKIESVGRRIGDRFCLLNNSNSVHMAQKNPYSTAMTWTYGTEIEDVPSGLEKRVVGILRLDGDPRNQVRVWYDEKLPTYRIGDIIYLSDLYNEVLMAGLCWRLAKFFELSDQKKADCETDFTAAKSLIKRNNATQRTIQNTLTGTSWNDAYYNGLNGVGM